VTRNVSGIHTLSMSCLKLAYTPLLLDTVPWNSSNFSEYTAS